MTPGTNDVQQKSRSNTALWIVSGVGAGIGIAALVYSRRRRSPWDRARDRANQLIDTARDEYEPWMGIAAATATAGTALAAFLRSRQESPWDRATGRANQIASRVGAQATNPWVDLGATAAIALASVVYARNSRRRHVRGIDADTAATINRLADKGQNILRRFREISETAGKSARRAMA